jgi:AcrR family transcriptional regulator
VGKGDQTRRAVLDQAMRMVSAVGMRGLTIGTLAEATGMSKSGLFGHFNSKEQLQLAVLDHAAELFIDVVLRPALKAPRGEPRLRELFERKLSWDGRYYGADGALPGGCIFTNLATELDDEPDGPLRDKLVQHERDWHETVATVFAGGVTEGDFAPGSDPVQFAYDLHGVMLAHHYATRLMRDPDAERRARASFESLLRARAVPPG